MFDDHIDLLMNDHGLIEKSIVLFEKELKKEKPDVPALKSLLDILYGFGEKCHNMREEKIYFPLLLERGLPPQGPVAVMLQEHDNERQYLTKLNDMLNDIINGKEITEDFKLTFAGYAELTKGHVWKENDILYPMGRRVLKPNDNENLLKEFAKLEMETIGAGALERFKIFVDMLEQQTGNRINLLASLSNDVIGHLLDTLPVEISFVDADDRVRYFNKLYDKKIFARTLAVVGRNVRQCHPPKSVHIVEKIISEMKSGKRDDATFWINFGEMYVHISYYAVRDENGKYEGCVEMVHDIKPYRDLEGDKRLLDE
jgi:uncharacterized protein